MTTVIDLARVEAAQPAPARTTGIISFPPILDENRYQRELYDALAPHGYQIVDGHIKTGWLARNRHRAKLLHFHWPYPYYRYEPDPDGPRSWLNLAVFTARLLAARALGYKIAWTIHEVFPLGVEDTRFDRRGGRVLVRLSSALFANDQETADKARSELGAKDVTVVPHSSYVGAYPEGRSREEVREELGIAPDATVFLLFGHISAYKQVDWFVEAFRAADLRHAELVVAGLVMDEPSAEKIRAAAGADPRVHALLEFIPDERVTELFGASDLAICPRQDGGTSGALVLAMSMGVAPITASAPTYTTITHGEEAAWLFAPYDRDALISTLQQAAGAPEDIAARGRRGLARMADYSWDGMAKKISTVLDRVFGRAD